ncbi:IclR family transcriptional regulator [Fodinicurvata sp. EGI_FJ10296]|uniref:IclR family transcriptional regulator n=1 Tax=Fodinicurvata sp. EGI_FJ10296 TaxID=3231908 RepID=UPI003454FF46
MSSDSSPEKITAIDKALMLLTLVGENGRRPLRLTDIVELSGFSKPTVHRLLNALRHHGLVILDESTHKYELGSKVLVLGAQYRSGLNMESKALPLLRELVRQAAATVHMGIRDGIHAVYIEKVESDQSIRLASGVGQRASLHSSSIGKVLLAHSGDDVFTALVDHGLAARTANTIVDPERLRREIADVRQQGFAVDDQENEIGIRCVAAPIRDHRGEVIASISISGTLTQVPKQSVNRQVMMLMESAKRISAALGYREQRIAG